MPSLSVRNLEVTFVDRTLFSNVSFDVEPRDKMGFIGANGVGKTTLFRVLSGELAPTNGTVAFEKSVRVGYMEQHSCKDPEVSVFDELVSVFDHLKEIEQETAAVTADIENKNGDINALVERQTALIEEYESRGGLTYKTLRSFCSHRATFCFLTSRQTTSISSPSAGSRTFCATLRAL